MTLEERMHVTELARAHWRGAIVNNVSTTAVLDAHRLLAHSREPVATAQVSHHRYRPLQHGSGMADALCSAHGLSDGAPGYVLAKLHG